jgi:hypothetical protein
MHRRLLNFLTALSLLTGIAVAGVWMRSYFAIPTLACGEPWDDGIEQHVEIRAISGKILVSLSRSHSPRGPNSLWGYAPERASAHLNPFPAAQEKRRFYFERLSYNFSPDLDVQITIWSAGFPAWFALLLCLPIPAAWLLAWRRRLKRKRQGHCRQCGYDLQGLPGPRSRCPECGTENQWKEETGEKPDADRAIGILN